MSSFPASTLSAAILTSGFRSPILIVIPIIVAVVGLKVLLARRRGLPALGGKVVMRCSKGHLFGATWSPLGSVTTIRLGFARFQRCPVGDQWTLVRPVNDADLTDEDRRIATGNGD